MELQAEDEQSFLSRQLNQLQAGRPDAMRVSPGVQKTPDRRVAGSPGIQANLSTLSATKKPDGYVTEAFHPSFLKKKIPRNLKIIFFNFRMKSGVSGSGEGVLANFFNSLLHKKNPGSPGNVPGNIKAGGDATITSADKAAMRSDAAAELERLSRAKKTDVDSSEC